MFEHGTTIKGLVMGTISTVLGKNVKRLRKARKWSQYDLADRINASHSLISRLEAGDTWISEETLSKLAGIFSAHVFELFVENAKFKINHPERKVSLREALDVINQSNKLFAIKIKPMEKSSEMPDNIDESNQENLTKEKE